MFSIRCAVFQTPSTDTVELLEDVVITVDGDTIISMTATDTFEGEIDVELDRDTVLVPGFIDLHIHAPQWPQLGTGYDVPLDEWLFQYLSLIHI